MEKRTPNFVQRRWHIPIDEAVRLLNIEYDKEVMTFPTIERIYNDDTDEYEMVVTINHSNGEEDDS